MATAPSRAVGLVYCFDAMVHFNPDVVGAYLAETRRCLKPGGHGFFHHSNHLGGPDWQANPHARNVMSAALFRGFAAAARLEVVEQRVIDWGDAPGLDCVTLVRKGT